MVYRGKPSKGCELCRQRRIQCDQKPGGCAACKRVGKPCSGYRDELDALFVDQTGETLSKHASKTSSQASKRKPSAPVDTSATSSTGASGLVVPGIRPEFGRPAEADYALACCYEHHLLHGKYSGGANRTLQDGALLSSLRALGMASMSAQQPSSDARGKAYGYYLTAIQQLNINLRSPTDAAKDETVLTVLALSYFESILGSEVGGIDAWAGHIEGTAALLRLRGEDQLRSVDGRILFMQATTSIMSNCLRSSRRLPASVRTTMEKGATFVNTEAPNPLWKIHRTSMEFVDFYADVMNGCFNDAKVVMGEALRLDGQFASAFKDAAPTWQYTVLNTDSVTGSKEGDFSFPGHSLIYQSSLAAQLWTSSRNSRMICHTIIVRTLERLAACGVSFEGDVAQRTQSIETIMTLSKDILASVPQHLGGEARGVEMPRFAKLSPAAGEEVTKIMDYERASLPVLRTSTGYLLIWCVAAVGQLAPGGGQIRTAACQALRSVGKALGIGQAMRLAELLSIQTST